MCKNINKILKKLELEIYEEFPERQELVNFIKIKGYENIKEAFYNNNSSVILDIFIHNPELSYSEISNVLSDIEFHSKY